MLSPSFHEPAAEREVRGWRKEGEEMGGGVTRYADPVVRAVQGYPLGSPALDSYSWGTVTDQSCCSDHTRLIKPASAIRRSKGIPAAFPD